MCPAGPYCWKDIRWCTDCECRGRCVRKSPTTSLYSSGKKASPPVTPARRRSTSGLRSASLASKMPMVYTSMVDCPASLQDFGQRVRTRVIAAVADDDQHLLLMGARLQSLARLEDRVVKRRSARGRCVGNRAPEVLGPVAERQVVGQAETHLLVEVDDKHLVLGAAGLHERPGARNHIRKLRPHAPAVVDHQSHRDRNVFVPEQADGLPDAVFVNLKVLFAQIGGKPPFAVAHRGVQQHQIDVYRKPVRLTVDRPRRLRFDPARKTDQEQQREHQRVRDGIALLSVLTMPRSADTPAATSRLAPVERCRRI